MTSDLQMDVDLLSFLTTSAMYQRNPLFPPLAKKCNVYFCQTNLINLLEKSSKFPKYSKYLSTLTGSSQKIKIQLHPTTIPSNTPEVSSTIIDIPRPETSRYGNPFPPRRIYLHNLYYIKVHCNRLLFILQHNNLTIPEQLELRKSLTKVNAELLVIRLGIFRAILQLTGTYENLTPLLVGPTCIITSNVSDEENPKLIKDLLAIINKNKKLLLVGGKLDSNLMNIQDIERVSELPGIHTLHSELLGVISSPTSKIPQILSQTQKNLLLNLETHKTNLTDKESK
ncbi:4852_t:CDS:2 [Ambispora gerdemannii]|uniref:4852_t:CDS:1 n=1 Tax=Ambispora gerdemannii TaxID=144530 RepID=A0A9N9C1T2_9GLOM|nr:4852_t:CDS:2 [Ambispora gerdemannii]